MAEQYLVFDLETIGANFDSLSDSQKEYITRNSNSEEERIKKINEMALSPISGKIICIGMLFINGDINTEPKAIAYSVDNRIESDAIRNEFKLDYNAISYISSEKRALEEFWKIFEKYPNIHLVSFNGRNFDAPYLMLRSAINRIRPSRNLMSGTKFNYDKHTDLIDELTFYNPTNYGATKRFNFDYYSYAFGITSPKGEGVDGSKVGKLFEEGKFKEIAEYCLRDVYATWELYKIWEKYLKFRS